MKITITSGDIQKEIEFFGRFKAGILPALAKGINTYLIRLRDYIVSQKLSGQVLKVQTGTLRSSIMPILATIIGGRVQGGIGTNVIYARIHEFGGVINRSAIFPKNAEALHFFIGGKEIFAKRVGPAQINMPARPYALPSLRETEDIMITSIQNALNKEAEK